MGQLVAKKGVIHLVRAMAAPSEGDPCRRAGDRRRRPVARRPRDGGRAARRARAVPRSADAGPGAGPHAPRRRARRSRRSPTTAATPKGCPSPSSKRRRAGTQLVVSTSGGTGEGVVHGETGYLFSPGDETALTAHLTALLADAALRERMSRAARAHMEAHFDLARQTAALEAIYDDVRTHHDVRTRHDVATRPLTGVHETDDGLDHARDVPPTRGRDARRRPPRRRGCRDGSGPLSSAPRGAAGDGDPRRVGSALRAARPL